MKWAGLILTFVVCAVGFSISLTHVLTQFQDDRGGRQPASTEYSHWDFNSILEAHTENPVKKLIRPMIESSTAEAIDSKGRRETRGLLTTQSLLSYVYERPIKLAQWEKLVKQLAIPSSPLDIQDQQNREALERLDKIERYEADLREGADKWRDYIASGMSFLFALTLTVLVTNSVSHICKTKFGWS